MSAVLTLRKQRTNILLPIALIAVLSLGLGAGGCSPIRRERIETKTIRRTVELGNARAVRAKLAFGVGNVKVAGGATELMDAKFVAGPEEPKVSYASRGKLGRLAIKQPHGPKSLFMSGGNRKSELRLNNKVPLDLDIDLEVGDSLLELGDLNIERVDIDGGVGDAIVDLRGRWDHDVDVNIELGVGDLRLRLPRDFAVRIDLNKGVGDFIAPDLKWDGSHFVNSTYPKGQDRLDIKIEQNVGDVVVE